MCSIGAFFRPAVSIFLVSLGLDIVHKIEWFGDYNRYSAAENLIVWLKWWYDYEGLNRCFSMEYLLYLLLPSYKNLVMGNQSQPNFAILNICKLKYNPIWIVFQFNARRAINHLWYFIHNWSAEILKFETWQIGIKRWPGSVLILYQNWLTFNPMQ